VAARDLDGFRPLCLGQLDNGAPVVASETCALDIIDATYIRDIEPGEMTLIVRDDQRQLEAQQNIRLAPGESMSLNVVLAEE